MKCNLSFFPGDLEGAKSQNKDTSREFFRGILVSEGGRVPLLQVVFGVRGVFPSSNLSQGARPGVCEVRSADADLDSLAARLGCDAGVHSKSMPGATLAMSHL